MGSAPNWTPEEIEFLEESWGSKSYKAIAKALGRPPSGVVQKAQRIGLGDPLQHIEGVSLSQLSKELGLQYNILINWEEKYGLPVKFRKFGAQMRVKVVMLKDFWKWAEKNRQMIDFSRTEKGFLGAEPDWVAVKRSADIIRKTYIPKPHNEPWSDKDISRLLNYTRAGMSYPELQRHLRRSEGAIKRKFYELGIPRNERPKPLSKLNKYSAEEERYIIEAVESGKSFEEIADKLNRSSLGIRGKMERMGYGFVNGTPYRRNVMKGEKL